MCDYDADICKVLVVVFAIAFAWVTLDFFIIQYPKMQETRQLASYEEYLRDKRDRQDLYAAIRDIGVNTRVYGRVDSNIVVSGSLGEYEIN